MIDGEVGDEIGNFLRTANSQDQGAIRQIGGEKVARGTSLCLETTSKGGLELEGV